MAKNQKIRLALALSVLAMLFQNCAAAPPPDLGKLSQSSSSVGNVVPTNIPGTVPTPFATPRPTPTPTPTPNPSPNLNPTPAPVTQTYSWSIGTFGACNGTFQTRAVICVNSLGTVVADSNCSTPKPVATQACSITVPYTCTATRVITTNSFIGVLDLCSFSCVSGTKTYSSYASISTQCNANPMLVPGTENGFDAGSNSMPRPFTNCTVTQPLTQVSSTNWSGSSQCN